MYYGTVSKRYKTKGKYGYIASEIIIQVSMSKEHYINTLQVNEEFMDFFMNRGSAIKQGSNGKNYLDITLADCTGDINSKKWDVTDDECQSLCTLHEGDVVKVKAIVTEWNGIKQLKIQKIRLVSESDPIDMTDFIKAAPEKPEDMFSYLMAASNKIKDSGLQTLVQNTLSENKERLMFYPGASKNHHAEFAGLMYHMKRMLDMGMKAVTVYQNLDPDWVITGVIMHDMEKLNEIEAEKTGMATGYSVKGKLLGHLVMGAIEMKERGEKAGLSEEKITMLQHMMISHHYEPDFGSPIKPLFPEAELLHYLDMIDAKMYDFEDALSGVDPGQFSEHVRTLDGRMLYKPSFAEE